MLGNLNFRGVCYILLLLYLCGFFVFPATRKEWRNWLIYWLTLIGVGLLAAMVAAKHS